MHISHLHNKSEQDINKLLGMMVDVENMYTAMNREENEDTKKVYSYLFKVFRIMRDLYLFIVDFIVVAKMHFDIGYTYCRGSVRTTTV